MTLKLNPFLRATLQFSGCEMRMRLNGELPSGTAGSNTCRARYRRPLGLRRKFRSALELPQLAHRKVVLEKRSITVWHQEAKIHVRDTYDSGQMPVSGNENFLKNRPWAQPQIDNFSKQKCWELRAASKINCLYTCNLGKVDYSANYLSMN